jgi:hypothetical protein
VKTELDRAVPEGRRTRTGRAGASRVALVAVGVMVAILAAACSKNQDTREVQQNASSWGLAICKVAEAADANSQQQAVGQAKHYSDTAVQQISSMSDGAATIDSMVDQLDADKTANNVTKIVPDLRGIQEQASSLSGQTDGDESSAWDSLSGAVSDCIAQLPPNLQGN